MFSPDILFVVSQEQHQDRLREAKAHRILQEHLKSRPTVRQRLRTLWSKLGSRDKPRLQGATPAKLPSGLF